MNPPTGSYLSGSVPSLNDGWVLQVTDPYIFQDPWRASRFLEELKQEHYRLVMQGDGFVIVERCN